MIKTLAKFASLATLGAFALVLSGVLFCSVTPGGMSGMAGMDAAHCPAAMDLHFDTIQLLTGAPAGFGILLALVALAGIVATVAVPTVQTATGSVRPSRLPEPTNWLRECFRRGILHPKIFPIS